MLAADSAWPTCGRSAWRSAANTRSVPSSASTLIAAATSAVRSSIRRSVIASTSIAEHPVGAVDERQPLLLSELARASARRPRALRRSASAVPAASRTSPSPISARAQ